MLDVTVRGDAVVPASVATVVAVLVVMSFRVDSSFVVINTKVETSLVGASLVKVSMVVSAGVLISVEVPAA